MHRATWSLKLVTNIRRHYVDLKICFRRKCARSSHYIQQFRRYPESNLVSVFCQLHAVPAQVYGSIVLCIFC